ncbi:putative centrosomal protein of 131kDa [Plasmopara halstedii]
MHRQHDAERMRVHARSRRSMIKDVDNMRLPVAANGMESIQDEADDLVLCLPSPQQEEEVICKEKFEIRRSGSKAGSNSSHRSASSSIYDYLDTLESEGAARLPLLESRAVSAPSYPTRRFRRTADEFGRVDTAKRPNSSSNFGDSFSPKRCSSTISNQTENSNTHQYYVGIKEKLATITIELNDKTKTIELLTMARKKDAAKTKQLLEEAEEHSKQEFAAQQEKFNKELEKQMDFSQKLVTEKSELAKRCNELVAEIQEAKANNAREVERFKLKLKDAKERWVAQEKIRREQWIVKKTEEIKKLTVAALEPDIQVILSKGKTDLEKAREAASEERRNLRVQLEKERDATLQRLRDEYERKLIEAREKERAKLMLRLDAADAELQQQLTSQRRRLQEEAEATRDELYGELRAAKLAHTNALDGLKERHQLELQAAAEHLRKEKQELIAKYEHDYIALREQTSVECEKFKVQLTSKLRDEINKEKQEMEKQMLRSRDAKIELVIEKLQEESRQMVERAESKALKKFSQERLEYERKLRQTGEIEGIWMEKNRELHERLNTLEKAHDKLKRENEVLKHDLREASEKSSDLALRLNEERQLHEHSMKQAENRCSSLQTETEYTKQQQSVEITALREKQAMLESHFQQQVQKLRSEHDTALDNLHERVRSTVARKDQTISELQEDLHLLQVKLEKSQAIIEEQRLQLYSK